MNTAVINKSKIILQLQKLRRLSQPFFLPIEQNNTEIAAVKRRDVHSVVLDQALKIAESYFQEHKITWHSESE